MRFKSFLGVNENSSIPEQINTVRHRARVALGIGTVACVTSLFTPVIATYSGNNIGIELARVTEYVLEGVAIGAVALAAAEVFTMIDLEQISDTQ
jgi:hypothetical protein